MVTVEREQRRGEAAVLRRIWRLHFWVGLLAAPALIVLACTDLVILYSQPLDLWLDRDLKVVAATNDGPTTQPPGVSSATRSPTQCGDLTPG